MTKKKKRKIQQKITEDELLSILSKHYNNLWGAIGLPPMPFVSISKPINENGSYVYELTMETW